MTKKATIVIADDDHILLELIKAVLRRELYQVIGEAHNGKDAIAKCGTLKPDLLLLDINMPNMDGFQVLEEILKLAPAPIVLMMSGDATMDNVNSAIKKGAVGFLVKPFNAASVLERVGAALKVGHKES